MLISRAFCIARRKRKLPSLLPPPSFAAMVISRLARVNACPRLASTMAFLCLMPAHFEWPDTLVGASEHAFGNSISAVFERNFFYLPEGCRRRGVSPPAMLSRRSRVRHLDR